MWKTVFLLGTLLVPPSLPAAPDDQAQVRQTVTSFLAAYNDLDWPRFQAFFAPDATVFFPFVDNPLRADGRNSVERVFQQFFEAVRGRNPGPPYLENRAEDLYVQSDGRVAVATFHHRSGSSVARRTLVLNRQGRDWKIVHFHGSNMASAAPTAP